MALPGKKKKQDLERVPLLEDMSEQALEESIASVTKLEELLESNLAPEQLDPAGFQNLGTLTTPIVNSAVNHYNDAHETITQDRDRPHLFALRLSLNADESALAAESTRLSTSTIKIPNLGGLTRPQRKAKVDQVRLAVVNMLAATDRRVLVIRRDKTHLMVPASLDLKAQDAAFRLGNAPACRIGSVVLKKEGTDDPESKGRMAANDDLAAALLPNAPTSRALDATECGGLSARMPKQPANNRPPINTGAFWFFPNDPIGVDQNGAPRRYPLVKIMDRLDLGPSLKDIRAAATAAAAASDQVQQLFSSTILGQLGQMALFDRITDNNDRFPGLAELTNYAQSDTLPKDSSILRNIEFIKDMRGIAPLDNAHPDPPAADRNPREQVGDPAKRGAYAHAFISFLFKHVSRTPGDAAGFNRCVADFLNGMELGLRDAKVVATMLGDQRPTGYPDDIAQAATNALDNFITIVTGMT